MSGRGCTASNFTCDRSLLRAAGNFHPYPSGRAVCGLCILGKISSSTTRQLHYQCDGGAADGVRRPIDPDAGATEGGLYQQSAIGSKGASTQSTDSPASACAESADNPTLNYCVFGSNDGAMLQYPPFSGSKKRGRERWEMGRDSDNTIRLRTPTVSPRKRCLAGHGASGTPLVN